MNVVLVWKTIRKLWIVSDADGHGNNWNFFITVEFDSSLLCRVLRLFDLKEQFLEEI